MTENGANLESSCIDNKGFTGDDGDKPALRQRQGVSESNSTASLAKQDELANEVEVVEELSLKRKVGLISGISLIVGTMIGSGIFISPKGVLGNTGSIGASLCVWAGCGLISMLGAVCYAELGLIVKEAGAEYAYLIAGFGKLHRFVGPIPGFLVAWISVLVLKPSSFAIIALAFAEYVSEPFFDACGPPVFIKKVITAACILTVTMVNCYSVKLAARVQVIFTFAKLSALLIIIIGGFVRLGQGYTENFTVENAFSNTEKDGSLFALAFYNGLWAYDGWNNLNYVTEEIQNPKRNLPLAIMIAIPLVTIFYLLVNISYFTVMSAPQLMASSAVAVTWGNTVLGSASFIIPISVALSTFGACNGSAFSGARLCFAAAREGHLPGLLSMVHVGSYTPLTALIFNGVVALLMIIPGDIASLIDFFSFTAWLFYGLTFLALIVMRFTHKDAPRPLKIPIVFPFIALFIAMYLVIGPIINQPQMEFLYAFIFLVAGLIFYVPFVYFEVRIPGVDAVTLFFQLFMEVSPTETIPDE
ncbi:b(0,+)-type amino acid transporter 1-like [Lineus longissimus]|uniref:b(0,+)-type amino acid transporter 1-like n=1 Tax=Lineus longissimus TaxID=88925 RepID=UPI002B4EBE88